MRTIFTPLCIYVFIMIFQLGCQKPQTDNVTPSSSKTDSLEFGAFLLSCNSSDPNIVGVAIIEYRGLVIKGVKSSSVTNGRIFSINKAKANNLVNPLKSTVNDFKNKSATLFDYKFLNDAFEDRLSKVDGYLKSYTLTQQQIDGLIGNQKIQLGHNYKIDENIQYASFASNLTSLFIANPSSLSNVGIDWQVQALTGALAAAGGLSKIGGLTPLTGVTVGELLGAGTLAEIGITLLPQGLAFSAGYGTSSYFLQHWLPDHWDLFNHDPNYSYDDFWLDVRDWLNKYDPFSPDPQSPNSTTQTTPNPEPDSTSSSTGDPHLATFDNLYYDFMGYGEFTSVKSTSDNFELQVRQVDVRNTDRVSFNTAIAVQTGTDIVFVSVSPDQLYINKTQQSLNFTKLNLKDNASIVKTKDGSRDVLSITTKNGDLVKVILGNTYLLDYYIDLNANRKGKVIGLMGNFDGNSRNDLQTRDGKSVLNTFDDIYGSYIDSWRITQDQSLMVYASGKDTQSYTKLKFPQSQPTFSTDVQQRARAVCINEGVTDEPYLSNCIMDIALTNDNNLAKNTFSAQSNKFILNSFAINQFGPNLDLSLNGSATFDNNKLILTKAEYYVSSSVYQKSKVNINNGFECQFEFSMSNLGGIADADGKPGGDGITFIMQNYQLNAPVSAGVGLGYDGLPQSFVVEFDSYKNGSDDKRLWINSQGVNRNSVNDAISLVKPDIFTFPQFWDGKNHKVKIKYEKTANNLFSLNLFFDGSTTPSLTAKDINISTLIGALDGGVFMGFSASTGSAYAIQTLYNWSIKTL